MKTYKLEKGIKVPPIARNTGTGTSMVVVTLQAMNAGESFLVRGELEGMQAIKKMRDFMTREREKKGKREFVSRRVKGGTRIWRTA